MENSMVIKRQNELLKEVDLLANKKNGIEKACSACEAKRELINCLIESEKLINKKEYSIKKRVGCTVFINNPEIFKKKLH